MADDSCHTKAVTCGEGVLENPRVREYDVELSFFTSYLREQPAKVVRFRDIRPNAAHIPSDFLHRHHEFCFAVTGDEDVCSFCDELLRGCKTDPATSTSHQCHFSIKLAQGLHLSSRRFLAAQRHHCACHLRHEFSFTVEDVADVSADRLPQVHGLRDCS